MTNYNKVQDMQENLNKLITVGVCGLGVSCIVGYFLTTQSSPSSPLQLGAKTPIV